MATIPTDVQKRINDMYNQQKNTQLGQLRAEQQKATQGINQQKTETGQQYYDKRNQADVTNFQSRRALQEMMAAQGLSRSGENISGQVGLNAARQNVLGGLNREEQNIMGSLTQRINEINDPSRANEIISAIESQRSAALAEALDRAIQRQQEQERFNQQLAWEKERFNREFALQQAKARNTTSYSPSVAPTGQDKSLADLFKDYQLDKGDTSILEKRSSVPARQASKSIGELLAERGIQNNRFAPKQGGGAGRRWISQY